MCSKQPLPLPQENVLIVDQRSIARNYLKFWFPLDVIATVPFELLGFAFPPNFVLRPELKVIRLLRLTKVIKQINVHNNVLRVSQMLWVRPPWMHPDQRKLAHQRSDSVHFISLPNPLSTGTEIPLMWTLPVCKTVVPCFCAHRGQPLVGDWRCRFQP